MWLNLVEHLLWEQGVAGSNPVIPIFIMPSSSVVERSAVNRLVVGSNPTLAVIIIMKKILYIISTIGICLFVSGCYSTKSMGDSEKADKYIFVY